MKHIENIEPEYIYVTIPYKYVCIYRCILELLSDYGLDVIKDCSANCNEKNCTVIECFNMFNSAVACYKLGKEKEANLIIKYVDSKLKQLYKNYNKNTVCTFPTTKEEYDDNVVWKELPVFGVRNSIIDFIK